MLAALPRGSYKKSCDGCKVQRTSNHGRLLTCAVPPPPPPSPAPPTHLHAHTRYGAIRHT